MKPGTHGQIKDLAIRILNLNPEMIDGGAVQRGTEGYSVSEVERRLIAFFNNGLNLVIKGPGLLMVDRTKPFNPAVFIGNDVTIWRGPKEGNGLEGEEAQDAISLALTEFDFSKVLFTTCLKEGETSITGEEKLSRHLAAKHIRLDAQVGQALLEEDNQATLNWLHTTFGITWLELPGTVLRYSDGRRYFLYLFRDDVGRWYWFYYWLDLDRNAADSSAVLAS